MFGVCDPMVTELIKPNGNGKKMLSAFPLSHVYVFPPLAFKVVVSPLQIAVLPIILKIGLGLTIKFIEVEVMPAEVVPETEYVVVIDGLTTILFKFDELDQVYEFAPQALNVAF